jgi:hypothetical protein
MDETRSSRVHPGTRTTKKAEKGKIMKCPECGLFNPPSTERCDCGHAFIANASPTQSPVLRSASSSDKFAKKLIYGAAIGAVIAIAIIIGSLGRSNSTTAKIADSNKAAESLEDRALKSGCSQFTRLVIDVRKGILTDQEIREKAKQIRLDFLTSGKPEAKEAGDHLLRSFTVGNRQDWNASFKEVRQLCGY